MFEHMTVARRLQAGFGIVLAVLVAVTAVAIYEVNAINTSLRANSDEHAAIQRFAINFRGSAHDRAIALRDVVLSASAADRQTELNKMADLAAFYASSATPLEALMAATPPSADLARLYAGIKDIEARAVATSKAVIARVEGGDADGAKALLWTQAKPDYVQWLAAINKLIDHQETRIQAESKQALAHAGNFLVVMLSALAVALVGSAALARAISRGILRQLGAEPAVLSDTAGRVAQGDLTPVPGAAQAAAGSVLASLAGMQASLAAVVGRVRQASDSIATGSGQIASGNADLSQRTEHQASDLQQTASSMHQMTENVRHNAEAARQATQLALTASTAATRGGDVVSQVVATMADITTSSTKIADIISVIDGIAFQTNILALNAAVEAARAGEQGRGFAVVASEVRSLAQRSAAAAREIKSLIGSSVERVDAGSRLVGEAGATMVDIVTQVKRVADLIQEISASTFEQTTGIGDVSGAVAKLEHATQQNAALVEQSAAASASLQEQAAALAEAVRVFRLEANPVRA